jgi:hypothetical protein
MRCIGNLTSSSEANNFFIFSATPNYIDTTAPTPSRGLRVPLYNDFAPSHLTIC